MNLEGEGTKINIVIQLTCYMVLLLIGFANATVAEAAHVGPTDNITKVANAIEIRGKSLTTMVSVPPGLAITQPVEISVGFYSPTSANRVTQAYSPYVGNRLLSYDAEGDGNKRVMRADITLSEPKPGGGRYSFGLSKMVTLEPLYSVAIGPLSFYLLSACDSIGKNEIYLQWGWPDGKGSEMSFSITSTGTKVISTFRWSKAELNRSKPLRLPSLRFSERDNLAVDVYRGYTDCKGIWDQPCANDWVPTSAGPLVLGKSRTVRGTVTEYQKQCTALYQYQVQSTLMTYPYL